MTIKKALSALLCLIICAGLVLPAFADDGLRYTVNVPFANVLPGPDAERDPIWTLYEGDAVYVTKTENNFGFITLRSNGVSGWVYMPLLVFSGAPAENTESIAGIYVKDMPSKTVYIEGEESFSADGLKVFAEYSDGKPDAEINGCRLYVPDFSAHGKKTVYVSYTAPGGAVFQTSFSVEVVKVPLDNMTLVSLPDKTHYIEGEKLDLTGIEIKLSYLDGRPDETYNAEQLLENGDFTILGCHSEKQGKALYYGRHTINIYYKYSEIVCSFGVEAVKKTLLSLELVTPPDSLVTYSSLSAPDLEGMTLRAVYDNGEETTVYPRDCDVECDPSKFVLGTGNKVKVSFEGMSVTLDFTFAIDEVTGLKIVTPKVLNFILGEKIDLSQLKVYITKQSGAETEIKNYSFRGLDPSVSGTQTAQVTYGEFSAVFNVNITPYYQKGDVDGRGDVTAADARAALRAAVKLSSLTGKTFDAADADRDGEITASDARIILRAAVKLEDIISFDGLIILPK